MKQYSRDKRSPIPRSAMTSKVMSAIKAKNTSPEVRFRQALREAELTGYRLHWKIEGRPDIAFPGKKLAIFIHGCFWHRCPICNLPDPKSNSEFWQNKFNKNIERDERKKLALEQTGWKVLTFWECQIKKDVTPLIEKVKSYIHK